MFRPLWLALVALGLWASLIPQVTYPSVSSGEPSDQILVAWPGWGVQQDLGHLSGTVGTFHVWVPLNPAETMSLCGPRWWMRPPERCCVNRR